MSVTDGSLTTDGAQQTVRVIGTVSSSGTVTANGGTSPSLANAWNIKVTDGADTASVSGLNQLLVTTGVETAMTTLTAASAAGNGTTAAFGSAKQSISLVYTTTAGISAGAIALEVSHDNTNFFRTGTPVTLTASAVGNIAIGDNAFRFARAVITTTVVGGTVSATIMAA